MTSIRGRKTINMPGSDFTSNNLIIVYYNYIAFCSCSNLYMNMTKPCWGELLLASYLPTLKQSINFTTNTILVFLLPSQLISYLSCFIFVFKNQPMHRCLGYLISGKKLFVAQQHIHFSSNLHSQFTVIASVFALYSRNKTFKCWEKQHETYFSLGNWHQHISRQLESLFSAFTLFYLVHRCIACFALFSWQIRPNDFLFLFFFNAVSFQCDYFLFLSDFFLTFKLYSKDFGWKPYKAVPFVRIYCKLICLVF